MKDKKRKPVIKPFPRVYESFNNPVGFMAYFKNEPSCFNGEVSIRMYKTTVEIIDEPIEVLQERLEKLWVESDNFHHYRPLEDAAKELGYTFKGKFRSEIKAKL